MSVSDRVGRPGAAGHLGGGNMDGHILSWSVDGSRFELQVGSDMARLYLPDGQLIDLTNHEWVAVGTGRPVDRDQ